MADELTPSNPKSDPVNPVSKQEDAKNPHNEPASSVGTRVGAVDANEEKRRAAEAEEQRHQWRKTAREWVTTGISIIAFIVSLLSYSVAKNALIMGQRAWVILDFVSPPGETDEEKRTLNINAEGKTVLASGVVNVGKSPALNVVVVGLSKIQDIGAPPPCNTVGYIGTTVSRATIPNDSRGKPLKSGIEVEDMTQENIRAIEAKTKRLFVYGLVLYDDVFDNKRKTTFCQFFVQGDKVSNFQNCPCGNDVK
jgi:hypothetical protein